MTSNTKAPNHYQVEFRYLQERKTKIKTKNKQTYNETSNINAKT